VATAIVVACKDWSVWDAVFDRTTSLSASVRGWSGGDGAVSSALPGTNRALFIFGDSYVTNIDVTGSRVGLDQLASLVLGNTVGVQSSTDAPSAANLELYGRIAPPTCTTGFDGIGIPVDPNKQPCAIQRLTTVPGPNDFYTPFFDHKAFGLTPAVAPWGFWPNGSFCFGCQNGTNNGKLVVSMAELLRCDPFAEFQCFPMCKLGDFPCHLGVKFARNVIASVANTQGDASNWVVEPNPAVITSDIQWGGSFVQEDDGYIYIYGTDEATQSNLYVARATPDKLLKPDQWFYWSIYQQWNPLVTPNLPWWPGGPALAGQLTPIATGVGPLANVTKVTRYGVKAYVLVYTGARDHFLYVRSSQATNNFAPVTPATPKVDLAAIDPTIEDMQRIRQFIGQCLLWQHNGELDYRNCGAVVHGRGLEHLSARDANGQLSALAFSYVVPADGSGSAANAAYYRPKFGLLPLDNLSPWCSGSSCWTGVARMYSIRNIAHQEQVRYQYDVSKASKLRVELLYGSGDPDLFVRFDSPAAGNTTDACAANSNNLPAVCELTTTGHTTAHVLVYGASAGTYLLRATYNGD
jgi:hypothetical protein